jgi:type III restriction enzyme
VPDEFFDENLIEAIAAALDLRQPNKEALESIVYEIGRHYVLEQKPPPFEAVVDSATGAGKTYILAAAIEYFAFEGVRNFAVITPGLTILEKTVANFTPGHAKSLVRGMQVDLVVVTSENFATAPMRAAMDDQEQVKLYVFSVQALIRPKSKVARRTHKFQEGLGQAFYERLQETDDLFVFADEHHTYYGNAFSTAVRDLHPRVLLGLTATPHRQTPEEAIIYRYPLAAAIADKLVKTPVIVGRKDDRTDPTTKLLDGVALLELKNRAIQRYANEMNETPVNPVMLVVAPSIAEAEEVEGIIRDLSFAGGAYSDAVLTVHSDAPDEALARLQELEDPNSPYRIVVSVGMLKEGWDVKNVYVICSLRASVSTLLTEQTLGRGLRLPFGEYTGIEVLDTLEVLGHERYEELLKKANVLNEEFIDRRTRAVLVKDAEGNLVPTAESTDVSLSIDISGDDEVKHPDGRPLITSVEDYTAAADGEIKALEVELHPRQDVGLLAVPRLRMTPITNQFSLADITEQRPFAELGRRIAADPAEELRRMRISARVVEEAGGLRRTELVTAPAVDRVVSPATLLPLDELRRDLAERVLAAPVVPARARERAAATPVIDAFLEGLGEKAEEILSGYMDRAAAGLISLVTEEHRKFVAKPAYDEVVELTEFAPARLGRPETGANRTGPFKRGVGYEGYTKSLYAQDWFDSSTERAVANILDTADEVRYWVRLQRGDLPILWSGAGREYNPDFIVVETDGIHSIVEVKMDKEMEATDVKAKREAARRWANHVSADDKLTETWRYLLVSETNVKTAKGSWSALRKLAT